MTKRVIISIGIIVVGLIAYVYLGISSKEQPYPQVVEVTIGNEVQVEDGGVHSFTHPRYGFSLSYPKELVVERVKEGNASETILFQESVERGDGKGFQIFITPYIGETITPDRIKKDIPNGDIREQVEVEIGDGMRAMAFKSSVEGVGETRELWFIHDGFIYEFTTAIESDAWLSGILESIEFKN